jgi:hypothetical protein
LTWFQSLSVHCKLLLPAVTVDEESLLSRPIHTKLQHHSTHHYDQTKSHVPVTARSFGKSIGSAHSGAVSALTMSFGDAARKHCYRAACIYITTITGITPTGVVQLQFKDCKMSAFCCSSDDSDIVILGDPLCNESHLAHHCYSQTHLNEIAAANNPRAAGAAKSANIFVPPDDCICVNKTQLMRHVPPVLSTSHELGRHRNSQSPCSQI